MSRALPAELRADVDSLESQVVHLRADVHDRLAPAWGDLVARVEKLERRLADLETLDAEADVFGLMRRVEILERNAP